MTGEPIARRSVRLRRRQGSFRNTGPAERPSASPMFAVPAPGGLPEGRADGHEHDSGNEDDDQPADVVAGTHVRRSRQPRVRHYANEESDDPGDDAGAEARAASD